MRLPPRWILFLIVFIEGFAVLASELLAIRQIIPYTGSGTDTVSIIIAAVLLPLAVGNFMGGRFKPNRNGRFFERSVRHKLISNIIIAMMFLVLGLSFPVMKTFFATLFEMDIVNRYVLNSAYALIFLIVPIYLLGQTLPLICHYFSREDIQSTTGKILFASTTGSFMGSVFCTMVLMAFVGVHYTVVIVITALAFLAILLSKKNMIRPVAVAAAIALVALGLNNTYLLKGEGVVANNEYHMVQILADPDEPNTKTMLLNGNFSARYTEVEQKRFRYERFIDTVFLKPVRLSDDEPKDILIIGAGGFVLGLKDKHNNITYIDIDGDLKDITEEQFLNQRLTENKTFEAQPARAYLTKAIQDGKKFDMIIIDVAQGNFTIPEHLITQNFYRQIYNALDDNGIMVANTITSPNFADIFSIKLDNTIRSVFPNVNRQVLTPYNGWADDPSVFSNMIYMAWKRPALSDEIYTDDKNPNFYDKFNAPD